MYPDALNNSEYLELYTRWFQFGAFCPLFRIHGENISREPWLFSDVHRASQEKYIKLRYELMPYIYSLGYAVHHYGYTIMRPLIIDFGGDKAVLSIQNQFMFGPSIMVCPVTEKGVTSRKVYLPKGFGWYDYYTNEYFEGGQNIVANAPLETIPLYVKAGSIIPTHKRLQFATDNYDTTFVKIYPGADGSFALYDDEGNNYNYEKEAYRLISIKYMEKTDAVSFAKQAGNGYNGVKKERIFSYSIIGKETKNVIIDYKE